MSKVKVRVQAVIFDKNNNMLLAEHIKNENRYWVLPGGKVEFGETLENAMKRELDEELGIKNANIVNLLYIDEFISDEEKKRHIVLVAFLVEIPDESFSDLHVVAEDESIKDIRLFTQAQLLTSEDTFYPSKDFISSLFENNTNN